jgi:hypothetical protein
MTVAQSKAKALAKKRVPPGPPALPLVGEVQALWQNALDFSLDNYHR